MLTRSSETRNSPVIAGFGAWSIFSSQYPMHIPAVKKSMLLISVSSEFGISIQDILGSCKKMRISDARQAAIYIAHNFGHPTSALVDLFHRTKWSIQASVRACEDKMDVDGEYFEHVRNVVTRLMQLTAVTPPLPNLDLEWSRVRIPHISPLTLAPSL